MYVELPLGYQNDDTSEVCKLKKAMYGMRRTLRHNLTLFKKNL